MVDTGSGEQKPAVENKTGPALNALLGVVLCLAALGALYWAATRYGAQIISFVYRDVFAVWNELFQLISVLISLMIFVLLWQLYRTTRTARHLAVALAFGVSAVLDLLYLFSIQAMPLIWFEGEARGTLLWLSARLILAGGLAQAALARGQAARHPMLSGASVGSGYAAALTLALVLYGGYIPLPAGIGADTAVFSLTMAVSLAGVILYLRLYRREGDYLTVALGLTVAAIGEIMLVRGREEMYLLGCIYQTVAYLLFFRGLFLHYVQKPYELLRQTEDKLSAAVADLERQVVQRTTEYSQANAKLLKNLEDAKNIQMALLLPNFPNFESLEFAVRYMPCEQVGGDFYRVFRLDDEHVGIFFGDVAGHGVSAAMVNVFVSQTVRFKVEYEGGHYRIFTPRGVLMHLHHSYNEMAFPEEIYILLFYGIYNTRSGMLTYSSAGFNMAPMIMSPDGKVRTLPMEGFPICHFGDHFKPTYKSHQTHLDPHDVMVLYSDGLIEIDRKRPDLFSPERVAECARAYAGDGPDAVCGGLMDAYYALRGKRKILDDVTVLAVKVLERR